MRADQGMRAIGLALAAGLLFGLSMLAAKALLTVANPWSSPGSSMSHLLI